MARKGLRIGATVGLVAGIYGMIKHASGGGSPQDKMGRVVESMIGINPTTANPTFQWQKMMFTLPVAGGVAASMIASKTGVNKYTPKGINI